MEKAEVALQIFLRTMPGGYLNASNHREFEAKIEQSFAIADMFIKAAAVEIVAGLPLPGSFTEYLSKP